MLHAECDISLTAREENPFPFKGKVGMGMGLLRSKQPHPHPTLPLKGRNVRSVVKRYISA